MATTSSKIYKRKCPVCLRKKEEAIREQRDEGKSCGHRQCAFKKEIKEAIQKKTQFKVQKIKNPNFKIQDPTSFDLPVRKLRKKIKISD